MRASISHVIIETGNDFGTHQRWNGGWLDVVTRLPEVLPGCLAEDFERFVASHPPVELATPLRLPRISELVAKGDLSDSDFKCSARPSDMVSVIEQVARVARVARVALDVDPTIVVDGDGFLFTVRHDGASVTLRLENRKYVDVTPIVEYLNPILAARTPRRQLYLFRAGGYSSGVVRATDDQARALRAAGYIR